MPHPRGPALVHKVPWEQKVTRLALCQYCQGFASFLGHILCCLSLCCIEDKIIGLVVKGLIWKHCPPWDCPMSPESIISVMSVCWLHLLHEEFGTGSALQDKGRIFNLLSGFPLQNFLIFDLSIKLMKPRKQPTCHSGGSEICQMATQDERPYFCLL